LEFGICLFGIWNSDVPAGRAWDMQRGGSRRIEWGEEVEVEVEVEVKVEVKVKVEEYMNN